MAENFTKFNDERLDTKLDELFEMADSSPYGHVNERVFPQISAVLIEIQKRISLRNEKSSKRFARWSLMVAIVAIVISIFQFYAK